MARWSSQFYEPVDGFPYVGRPLTNTNIYVATGFNGDGLTLGTAAGRLLADLIQKQENELASLWSPTRVRVRAAGDYIALNVKTARHFTSGRSDTEPGPGQGAVLRIDGSLRAVYRTTTGETLVHAARCPHLGCIVQWNGLEKTWDCPCHGGRSAPDGLRLEGPPRANLPQHAVEPAAGPK